MTLRKIVDEKIADAIRNGHEVDFPRPLVEVLQLLADAAGQSKVDAPPSSPAPVINTTTEFVVPTETVSAAGQGAAEQTAG